MLITEALKQAATGIVLVCLRSTGSCCVANRISHLVPLPCQDDTRRVVGISHDSCDPSHLG